MASNLLQKCYKIIPLKKNLKKFVKKLDKLKKLCYNIDRVGKLEEIL